MAAVGDIWLWAQFLLIPSHALQSHEVINQGSQLWYHRKNGNPRLVRFPDVSTLLVSDTRLSIFSGGNSKGPKPEPLLRNARVAFLSGSQQGIDRLGSLKSNCLGWCLVSLLLKHQGTSTSFLFGLLRPLLRTSTSVALGRGLTVSRCSQCGEPQKCGAQTGGEVVDVIALG